MPSADSPSAIIASPWHSSPKATRSSSSFSHPSSHIRVARSSASTGSRPPIARRNGGINKNPAAAPPVGLAGQTFGSGEPAAGAGRLPAQEQVEAEPERATSSSVHVATAGGEALRPLPRQLARPLLADEVGGDGEPLEVVLAERLREPQLGIRLTPRTTLERTTPCLHRIGHRTIVAGQLPRSVQRVPSIRSRCSTPHVADRDEALARWRLRPAVESVTSTRPRQI
jgi:hypothetical protein